MSTVALLIICGLIFWLKKDKKKEEQIKLEAAEKEAKEKAEEEKVVETISTSDKNYLEKAGELLQENSTDFYRELNYALKNYLSQKLHLPIETINKKNIAEQLDKKNISVNTAIQLQQILSDIELQLYAPFSEEGKKQELYDNTAAIIQLLDTYKN